MILHYFKINNTFFLQELSLNELTNNYSGGVQWVEDIVLDFNIIVGTPVGLNPVGCWWWVVRIYKLHLCKGVKLPSSRSVSIKH